MELKTLFWSVGHTADPGNTPEEMYPAVVPGAVQQDYARAKNWPPVQFGIEFKKYAGLEDLYWLYRTTLDFQLAPEQTASLVFKGIDYRYQIRIDGTVLMDGEGMFTPVKLDVTAYAGKPHDLEVLLYPAPKDPTGTPNTRDEARRSCKPAACYGWDWHPRLISSGIWDEAGLLIQNKVHINTLDASYRLSDDFTGCRVDVSAQLNAGCTVVTKLCYEGEAVAQATCKADELLQLSLDLAAPKLWNPTGYGSQSMYTLEMTAMDETGTVLDRAVRKIGFRRSKMVMNEGSWKEPSKFPKSRSDAPATLEINGRRIFAKGSNWVNMHLYPGEMNTADYEALLDLVKNANMNILRIWGGGFVNHEAFFDLCDEKGIMVWQEFPLACNEYPDDDSYLSVLEQEAVSIVRRLRTHPCLVLWCGGNELFNSWSKMTDQKHALRLLDKICYTEDRFTPFIMTSPLNGMGHGHYKNYDDVTREEFISVICRSQNTAYTEFGAPGAADYEYIRNYIPEEDLADCNAENEVWKEHHAFSAWTADAWLRKPEAEYYFGGYTDTADLCKKTQFVQSMCYQSNFEEMRRQWPHCSMALNWCFNEPWPSFANNSIVSWPAIPKPCYYAVQAALRPKLASLRVDHHLWHPQDQFTGQVWVLNDTLEALEGLTVEVSYSIGDGPKVFWGSLQVPTVDAQRNSQLGSVSFPLNISEACTFRIMLTVPGHPEMDSAYTYICKPRKTVNTKGILNL